MNISIIGINTTTTANNANNIADIISIIGAIGINITTKISIGANNGTIHNNIFFSMLLLAVLASKMPILAPSFHRLII